MRLPRYLAIAGPLDPFGFKRTIAPVMTKVGLTSLFSSPELQIYGQGPPPVALTGNTGLVLGPLFRQNGEMAAIAGFDGDESRDLVASRGQALIERCWGDYVAFVVAGGKAIVIRAPLSDLGCFHTRHRGLTLVASDLELLARCGVATDRPNWTEVARHLYTSGLRGPATCVAGVDELLWGTRMTVGGHGVSTEPCWTPWTSARASSDRSPTEHADMLRERALACVKAQVRDLGPVVAMLSGGLDSSLLTACLAQAGANLTCLNLPFGDANGDERIYARAVAARLGVPLFEVAPQLGEVDVTRCERPWLARPIGRAFVQALRGAKQRVAAGTGASHVVDGTGGDSLFCSMQSAAPVADRLLREGWGRGAVETAADMARLTGASLPRVLVLALRRAYLRRRSHRWHSDGQFLSRAAIARAGKPAHRWLKPPRGAVPGAATHIANMIAVENLIAIADDGLAEWSPLMAQPLVEFCLGVPSWHWFDKGHNRAVARLAFADLLPRDVAWRRDKGTPDGFVAEIFEANRDRLGDLLIGGRLDEAGLLDCEALRAALASTTPVKGHDYVRILRIADVEAWARGLTTACPASDDLSADPPPVIPSDRATP